jgi:hypothetical protein
MILHDLKFIPTDNIIDEEIEVIQGDAEGIKVLM